MRFTISQLVLFGIIASIAWKTIYLITTFRRNVRLAKSTGLPYVTVPFHPWSNTTRFLLPLLNAINKRLPPSLQPMHNGVSLFKHMSLSVFSNKLDSKMYPEGAKSYLIVAPGKANILMTRDTRITADVFSKKNEFVKPLDEYGAIDIYGQNVVSTEGDTWKLHRRIVGPPFNSKNDGLVWRETLKLTPVLLKAWTEQTELGLPISTLNMDTERLALFIISRAGFGIEMHWPSWRSRAAAGSTKPSPKSEKSKADEGTNGIWKLPHKSDFDTTMAIVNTSIIPILVIPHWILKNAPSKAFNTIYDGFVEFRSYMSDMIAGEKIKMQMKANAEANLVSNIIRASYEGGQNYLSEQEIFGNIFIMLIAGHETTAHTISYTMIKLAQNPHLIVELQQAVERSFGSKPISQWRYPEDFDNFAEGAALLNETLRMFPPLQDVLKRAHRKMSAQKLVTSDGMEFLLPPGTNVSMDVVNVNRSVEVWGPDASVYRPSRWIVDNSKSSNSNKSESTYEEDGATPENVHINKSSARIFKPPKGCFFPFSEGARACLGKRFALVEFAAVVAVLFRDHGVELDIYNDEIKDECTGKNETNENEVSAASKGRKGWVLKEDIARFGEVEAERLAYHRKTEYVDDVLHRSTAIITMKPPEEITLRWVPKGKEVWRKWASA